MFRPTSDHPQVQNIYLNQTEEKVCTYITPSVCFKELLCI